MVRRRILVGILAVLVMIVGIVITSQSKPTDLPPGVSAEMWIPINANAGVALNKTGRSFGRQEDGTITYGILMVKSHGYWQRVYLEPAPVSRFIPLK